MGEEEFNKSIRWFRRKRAEKEKESGKENLVVGVTETLYKFIMTEGRIYVLWWGL